MNKYNPNIHHRRSIRLKGYDYAQAGLYFITICVQNRECLFGKIVNGEMILNDAGKIAQNEWIKTTEIRQNVELGEFVIMPNHIHGIIRLLGRGELHSPDNETNVSPDNETNVSPDNETNVSPDNETNVSPDNETNVSPDNETNVSPDNETNVSPDDETNVSPDDETNVSPDNETNVSPDNETNVSPDNETNVSPDNETNVSPDNETNVSPDNETNVSPDNGGVCKTPLRSPSQTIGAIVRGYKSSVTKQLGLMGLNGKLWQRNYYEHIIRDEQSYQNISNYIINNPIKWEEDKFYSKNV